MKCFIGKEPVAVAAMLMEKKKRPKGPGKDGNYCNVVVAGMGWQAEWNVTEEVFSTLPPEGEKVVLQCRMVPCRAQVNRGGKSFYVDLVEPEVVSVVVAGNR